MEVFPLLTNTKLENKCFYTALGFNTGMGNILDITVTCVRGIIYSASDRCLEAEVDGFDPRPKLSHC